MRVYTWIWALGWLVIGAVPIGLGLLVASRPAVVCIGAISAFVVAATTRVSWPVVVWSGLLAAAMIAVTWILSEAAVGCVALVLATSPWAVRPLVRAWRRQRRNTGSRGAPIELAPVLTAELLAGPVHALSDHVILRAWSDSFVVLKGCRVNDQRLELASLRQAYLDELEARNSVGFHEWLQSGARPIGNPARFFTTPADEVTPPPTA